MAVVCARACLCDLARPWEIGFYCTHLLIAVLNVLCSSLWATPLLERMANSFRICEAKLALLAASSASFGQR